VTEKERSEKLRRFFWLRLAELSAKLATAFLVPALLGIYADKQLDSQYLWTLIGIGLGIISGGLVIKNIIDKTNQEVKNL
jgi:hypothetical protein